MTESHTGPVRYFCTAGNGMESFLVEEVKRKVAAQDIIQLQGKVIFSSSADIKSIISLKSAERLFLLLNYDTPLKLSAHTKKAQAFFLLKSKLIGDQTKWATDAMLWLHLQREQSHKESQKDSPTGSETLQRLSLKRKMDNDGQSLVSKNVCFEVPVSGENSERKRQRLEQENNEETPVAQQPKLLPSVDSLTFRICCKCSGSLARYFSTQDVSQALGASLTTLLGWRVDLRNPLLEVNVNLTDDYCLQGIPLTKFPLANRTYLQNTGLRSTVAWAMASVAQIQPGSFVVDPMCGVGTILIEAAKEHSGAYFLGIDIDDEQLVKANENVDYAHLEDRLQVLQASSLVLPLPSASMDAVVCDLPFGRKFGTKVDAAISLPLIVSEMIRVLRVGGILVLLLSPQLSCLLKRLFSQEDIKSKPVQEEGPTVETQFNNSQESTQETHHGLSRNEPFSSLRHVNTFRVSLGAIDGIIHKYVKSSVQ